ncbi:hypothetical protein OEZ85_011030 [Tetradesmus obliquus]|uniref:Uncharacterized protein n=1 Tax=Tetradesmus obliquus TaxID=3088 RepID=A0ABY8TPR2_TETOB|nr:hypothetical protein OEZ85_011030 [Tetradesmus obliquus]
MSSSGIAPSTPALVITQDGSTTPFDASLTTAGLMQEPADEQVVMAACRKLVSRIRKYGAVPSCSVHDSVWSVARLPLVCSILACVMLGRLPFSEHRHFLQQSLLPQLLQPGDAFMVFQEQRLAVAAAAGKHAPEGFNNKHKLLVFVGSGSQGAVEVNAQRCTSMLDFAWPPIGRDLPSYMLDASTCSSCEMVHVSDEVTMARVLANAAATFVMRPDGCVTALYFVGRYLAPVPPVLQCLQQIIADVFDLLQRVVNQVAMGDCSHGLLCALAQTPGAQGRLDYLHSVAGHSPATYLSRVLKAGLPEDYDTEFRQYIRLSDFESDGELIDYVVSGLSRQGQYIEWGAQGLGFFSRGGPYGASGNYLSASQ